MNDPVSALRISASGMRSQGERLLHSAENIANADTPGYRRKLISFEQTVVAGRANGEIHPGKVQLSQAVLPRIYDPSHPMADKDGYYDGSNVELVIELADSREASRSYEANLRMFEQTRQMSASLLDLLR